MGCSTLSGLIQNSKKKALTSNFLSPINFYNYRPHNIAKSDSQNEKKTILNNSRICPAVKSRCPQMYANSVWMHAIRQIANSPEPSVNTTRTKKKTIIISMSHLRTYIRDMKIHKISLKFQIIHHIARTINPWLIWRYHCHRFILFYFVLGHLAGLFYGICIPWLATRKKC